MKNQLSIRFLEIRKHLGLTQTDFAKALNTTQANIAKIESQRAIPNTEMLKDLFYLFPISPAYFFYGFGEIENGEWNEILAGCKIETAVINKLQTLKEIEFYRTIFTVISDSTAIQTFLCRFFKKMDTTAQHLQPNGAKEKLTNMLKEFKINFVDNFKGRYLTEEDRNKTILYVFENFNDDEAYFLIKNSSRLYQEIRKEMPLITKIADC